MPKRDNKRSLPYNLLRPFFDGSGNYYISNDDLVLWAQTEYSAPVDRTENANTTLAYVGTTVVEDLQLSPLGKAYRKTLKTQDSPDSSMKANNETDGIFSFSNASNGASPTSTDDRPFSISFIVHFDEMKSTNYLVNKGIYNITEEYRINCNTHQVDFALLDTDNGSGTTKGILQCSLGDTWAAYSSNPQPAGGQFVTGQWYHLVFTYDGRGTSYGGGGEAGAENAVLGMNIHVNGVKQACWRQANQGPDLSTSYVGMRPRFGTDLTMGDGTEFTGRNVRGNVGEFAVWTKELSTAECTALYNATVGAPGFGSGYLNNPAKVLLNDHDNRAGAYPSTGLGRGMIGGTSEAHGVQVLHRTDSAPFDDTRSINFENPFARSTVVFSKLPRDARFIRLIDADGSVVTFEFQRGVILREGSVAVDLTGRTKAMYRQRRSFLRKKIRDALPTSKYRKIDTQKMRDRVWAEFAAEKFAKAVNEYTGSLKIKARSEDNNVYLEQRVPGAAGNTIVYVMPPNAVTEAPEAYTVVPFTGGVDMDLMYPLCAQPQYQNLLFNAGQLVATPNFVTGSADADETSVSILAPGVARKGVADAGLLYSPFPETEGVQYTPFVDSRVILDEDDEFFDEGVPETLIENFNSPLRDKRMIVIDLPVGETTNFGQVTGSNAIGAGSGFPIPTSAKGIWQNRYQHPMVYYNFAEGKWEPIGQAMSNICNGTDQTSYHLDTGMIGFSRGVELSLEGPSAACRPTSLYGFPFHPKFHATGSQTLRMGDYIDAPFVLEKYVYVYSASFNCGTSYDFLSNMWMYDSSKTGDGIETTKLSYQANAQIDNGENWGYTGAGASVYAVNGTGYGPSNWAGWEPTYVDGVHRAAINSFFILRQTRNAQASYEMKVVSRQIDSAEGFAAGDERIFALTASVPDYYTLSDTGGTPTQTLPADKYFAGSPSGVSSVLVDTTRELVTYGQWLTYAPSPSGSIAELKNIVPNITGVLADGLAREVNTLDLGETAPVKFTRVHGVFAQQPAPTGSYMMKGAVKRPQRFGGYGTSTGSYSYQVGSSYDPEFIFRSFQDGGRSGSPRTLSSPRALVNGVPGQEILKTVPDLDYTSEANFLRASAIARFVDVPVIDDVSPYILLPEDELILGWQCAMPAKWTRGVDNRYRYSGNTAGGTDSAATATDIPDEGGDAYPNSLYFAMNGHGRIGSGPNMSLHPHDGGKLILYGSLIRDNREELPSLHQDLTSNAIHETIGNDPIFDEFDVEVSPAFYGTMANEIISGSMKQTDDGQGTRGARGVAKTFTAGTMGVSGSLRRMMMHVDSVERYYDTMAGDPQLYHLRCGNDIGKTFRNTPVAPYKNLYPIILAPFAGPTAGIFAAGPTSGLLGYGAHAINTRWGGAYPFEGHFDGHVPRLQEWTELDPLLPVTRRDPVSTWGTEDPAAPKAFMFAVFNPNEWTGGALYGWGVKTQWSASFGDTAITDRDGNISTRPADIQRFWFGIGDGVSGSADLHYDFDPYAINPGTGATRKAYCTVRGWKYGLMSALPLRSTAAFRRDRFGQFRDMLEQRHDGRFFNTAQEPDTTGRAKGLMSPSIQIRFVDAETGDLELAENTHCQNLSAFATSSLPYFDGEMRDRTTDPDENEDFVVTN